MFAAATSSSSSSNLIVGIIFIVVVVALVTVWRRRSNKKTRAEAWLGVVSKKHESTETDDDGNRHTNFILTVAIDGTPKPKTLHVNPNFFKSVNEGDELEKKLGELQPTKVGVPAK